MPSLMEGGGGGMEVFSPQQFQCALKWNKHITPHYRLKSMKSEQLDISCNILRDTYLHNPSLPLLPFVLHTSSSLTPSHCLPSIFFPILHSCSEHSKGSANHARCVGCICNHKQKGCIHTARCARRRSRKHLLPQVSSHWVQCYILPHLMVIHSLTQPSLQVYSKRHWATKHIWMLNVVMHYNDIVYAIFSCRIDESLCRVDDSVETEDTTLLPYERCDTRATEAGQE